MSVKEESELPEDLCESEEEEEEEEEMEEEEEESSPGPSEVKRNPFSIDSLLDKSVSSSKPEATVSSLLDRRIPPGLLFPSSFSAFKFPTPFPFPPPPHSAASLAAAFSRWSIPGGSGLFTHPVLPPASERRPINPNKPPPLKKYKCDVCGKAFSRSNTLITHKRIHTGEKPFKCEHCGRAFRQPGNLTRHRLTHTTVKPYICGQCGKAFNRASNLHTHMRTHSNFRPFICPYCGKGFHQKIDMKIHIYTHTGDRPFRSPFRTIP